MAGRWGTLFMVAVAAATWQCRDPLLNKLPEIDPLPDEDVTPPEVRFLAPASGSTVGTTISLEIEALDEDSGIRSVELTIDDAPIVAPLTEPPFVAVLDTRLYDEGPLTVVATATDDSEARNTAFARLDLVIDNSPLSISLLTVSPNPAGAADEISVEFVLSEEPLEEPRAWVGSIPASLVSALHRSYAYSLPAEDAFVQGPVAVTVEAKDLDGNVVSATGSTVIDTVAPELGPVSTIVTVEHPNPPPTRYISTTTDPYVSTVFSLSVPSSDVGEGLDACEACVSLDGTCDDEWSTADIDTGECAPFEVTCNDMELLTLAMRATDRAGNTTTTSTVERTCLLPLSMGPMTPSTVATRGDRTYVAGSFDLSTSFTSSAPLASCDFHVDFRVWQPAVASGTDCLMTGLTCVHGEGLDLNMRAYDQASHFAEGEPFGFGVICDAMPPNPGSVQATPSAMDFVTETYDAFASFSEPWVGGLVPQSEVASCESCVSTDDVCDTEWVPGVWSTNRCEATGQSCTDGATITHGFRAVDAVGNQSDATTRTFTCDALAPSVGSVVVGTDATYVGPNTVVTATFDDGSGSGLGSCEICVDSTDGVCDESEFVDTIRSGSTCEASGVCDEDVNQQTLTLQMRGTDRVGHVTSSGVETRICDVEVPVPGTITVTASEEYGSYVNGTVHLSEDFVDLHSGVTRCEGCIFSSAVGYCDSAWESGTWTGTACELDTTCPIDGSVTLTMRAYDAVDNRSHWNVETTSRICDTTAPPAPTLSGTAGVGTASLSWNNPGGGMPLASPAYELHYGLNQGGPYDGTGATQGDSPLSIAGTSLLLEGLPPCTDYYFVVTATDAFGRTSALSDELSLQTECVPEALIFEGGLTNEETVAPVWVTAGELRREGAVDLVVVYPTTVVIASTAGGAPVEIFQTSEVGIDYVSAITVDLDEDGALDLLVADAGADAIRIWLGDKDVDGHATGTLTHNQDLTVGISPSSLVAGDFDTNRVLDLAVATEGDDSIAIFDGQGTGYWNGTFVAGPVYATVSTPKHIVAGDFNDDLIDDLAVASAGADGVHVLIANRTSGQGNGTFAAAQLYGDASSLAPQSVAIGDFDADGILDLATANYGSGNVSVFLGDGSSGHGDGTFAPPTHHAVGTAPISIVTADFDGDAIDDLAVGDAVDADLYYLLGSGLDGRGNGDFVSAVPFAAAATTSIVLADLGSDTVADVVMVDSTAAITDPALAIMRASRVVKQPDGTLASGVGVFQGSGSFTDIATGDFDADGIIDIIVADSTSKRLQTLLGNGAGGRGDGSFSTGEKTPSDMWSFLGHAYRDIVVLDVNADNILDVLVTSGTYEYNTSLQLWLGRGTDGRGDGGFGRTEGSDDWSVNIDVAPGCIAVGDFWHNRINDLALCASNSIEIVQGGGGNGRGNGTFTSFVTPVALEAGEKPVAIAVADYNSDGEPDLAVAISQPEGEIKVFTGSTQFGGNFSLHFNDTGIGTGVHSIVAVDVDEDGILDLVVTEGGSPDSVSVYRGNGSNGHGDGTFTAPSSTHSIDATSRELVAVDFDRDGAVDLAAACGGSDTISVLLGTDDGAAPPFPDGGFATVATYAAGTSPYGQTTAALAVGDFDADGTLDVATVNEAQGGTVTILFGNGTVP